MGNQKGGLSHPQKTTEKVSQNTNSPQTKQNKTKPHKSETLKNIKRAGKAVMVGRLLEREQGRS